MKIMKQGRVPLVYMDLWKHILGRIDVVPADYVLHQPW